MNDQGETPIAPSKTFDDLRVEVKAEQVTEGETETVKKRGRPKGSTNKPKDSGPPIPDILDLIDAEVVKDACSFCFDLMAARKGDHWKLSDEEKSTVGRLTTRVLNKRGGEFLKEWGDELALTFVLVIGVGARLKIDRDIKLAQTKVIDVQVS
jgi:hypothetical protein